MSLHTAYRFGHYRLGPDNRQYLIWTPDQGEIELGLVPRGSAVEAEIMADESWRLNALVDEGEQAILESFFRNNHTPTFYFALFDDGAIAETDGLSDLTNEQTGSGYSRISVARDTNDWGAASLDSGDMKTTSATKTFTATAGDWIASSELVLAETTDNTGNLYAWVSLSQSRTLADGDSLDVSMGVKLA